MKEMLGGCCVCADERGWDENPLVYCDGQGCTVAVHQACYGIVTVPTGPWFCRKCESQERAARVKCELCPQRDGALKRTDGGGWCHVVCGLYIPEAWFGNVQTMEPIILKGVPSDRYNKLCYICEELGRAASMVTSGACMQCNRTGCKQHFHVTCAQAHGLLCEEAGANVNDVKYCGYCQHHNKKKKKDGHCKSIAPFKPISADFLPDRSSPQSLLKTDTSLAKLDVVGVKSGQSDAKSEQGGTKSKNLSGQPYRGQSSSGPIGAAQGTGHHLSTPSKAESKSRSALLSASDTSHNTMPPLTKTTAVTSAAAIMDSSPPPTLVPAPRIFSTTKSSPAAPIGKFTTANFTEMTIVPSPANFSTDGSKSSSATTTSGEHRSSSAEPPSLLLAVAPTTLSTSCLSGRDDSKPSKSSTDLVSSALWNDNKSTSSKFSSSSSDVPNKSGSRNKQSAAGGKSAYSASDKEAARPGIDTKDSCSAAIGKGGNGNKSSRSSGGKSADTSGVNANKSCDSITDKTGKRTSDYGSDLRSDSPPILVAMPPRSGTFEAGRRANSSAEKDLSGSQSSDRKRLGSDVSSYEERLRTESGTLSAGGGAQLTVDTSSPSPAPGNKRNYNKGEEQQQKEKKRAKRSRGAGAATAAVADKNSSNQKAKTVKDFLSPVPSDAAPITQKSPQSGVTKQSPKLGTADTLFSAQNMYNSPHKSDHSGPAGSGRHRQASSTSTETGGLDGAGIGGAFQLFGPPVPSAASLFNASQGSSTASAEQSSGSQFPQTMEQLLERQWVQGSQFLMEQGQHFDIASLLSCLYQLRQENQKLEEHITGLTSRRDQLLAVNARLSVPFAPLSNTPTAGNLSQQAPPMKNHTMATPPAAGSTERSVQDDLEAALASRHAASHGTGGGASSRQINNCIPHDPSAAASAAFSKQDGLRSSHSTGSASSMNTTPGVCSPTENNQSHSGAASHMNMDNPGVQQLLGGTSSVSRLQSPPSRRRAGSTSYGGGTTLQQSSASSSYPVSMAPSSVSNIRGGVDIALLEHVQRQSLLLEQNPGLVYQIQQQQQQQQLQQQQQQRSGVQNRTLMSNAMAAAAAMSLPHQRMGFVNEGSSASKVDRLPVNIGSGSGRDDIAKQLSAGVVGPVGNRGDASDNHSAALSRNLLSSGKN